MIHTKAPKFPDKACGGHLIILCSLSTQIQIPSPIKYVKKDKSQMIKKPQSMQSSLGMPQIQKDTEKATLNKPSRQNKWQGLRVGECARGSIPLYKRKTPDKQRKREKNE